MTFSSWAAAEVVGANLSRHADERMQAALERLERFAERELLRPNTRGPHLDHAAAFDRIARVQDEVGEDPLELPLDR